MGRTKLRRFSENRTFEHLSEPRREELIKGFGLRGCWNERMFSDARPITLELGCGKGEYTLALAERYPERNFVGVDIKGARLWRGAKTSLSEGRDNVAFLRCQIELIDRAFAEAEVDEIWITFPDPQIKHKRAKHRLTGPAFLEKYKRILTPEGRIHLKTDSEFLHGYSLGILEQQRATVHQAYYDIDRQLRDRSSVLHSVQTHYEGIFREKGKAITYLECSLFQDGQ